MALNRPKCILKNIHSMALATLPCPENLSDIPDDFPENKKKINFCGGNI